MDQVEEIKGKVDIVQLVGEYVRLTKAGRNFKGLCPFHGEKTPSFMVNPELQIYKCFGCGEGGDAYSFLQKMEGMEFGEALKTLAKRVGVTLESYAPSKGEEDRERLYKINYAAADFYHYLLTKHRVGEAARKYLQGRKMSPKAIETFKIGFVPEGWDFLIKYLVGKKGFKIDDLTRAGLVVDGRYDRFRNRVMFPLNNHRGQTVGFAGRILPVTEKQSDKVTEQAKYVNTPETEIYHKGDLLYGLDINKAEIKKSDSAVIVEGEIDAIASWQAGVKNAVAVKGSALTSRQVELLRRLTDKVVLGMDADLAGGSAARRGIEIAEKAGLFVETVDWGLAGQGEKDVADVVGENPEKWQEMTQKVISIYSFYIDTAIKKFGNTPEGKARVSRDVLGFLAGIGDEIKKDEYIKELAVKAGIGAEVLREQMKKAPNPNNQATNKSQEPNPKSQIKTRREVVEEYVVGLALRNAKVGQLTSLPTGRQVYQLFKTPFWKRVLDECSKFNNQYSIKDLVHNLPSELRVKVEELMLVPEELNETEAEKEWQVALDELEEIGIRERIQEIKAQEGKIQEVKKLMTRLNELTKDR